MSWGPDPDGVNGVYLGKNVVTEAGKALSHCMKSIAPRVMTWKQYGEAAVNYVGKDVMGYDLPEYQPDFTQGVNHFAIHAGELTASNLLCILNLGFEF
jgi:3-ketoacyl-CoA synthase